MRRCFLIALIVTWVGLDWASALPASRLLMDSVSIEKFEEVELKDKEERTVESRYSVRQIHTPCRPRVLAKDTVLPRVLKKQAVHPSLAILHRALLI